MTTMLVVTSRMPFSRLRDCESNEGTILVTLTSYVEKFEVGAIRLRERAQSIHELNSCQQLFKIQRHKRSDEGSFCALCGFLWLYLTAWSVISRPRSMI